ncbi:hypothetical protein PG987_008109 [Apiospora arundinis]
MQFSTIALAALFAATGLAAPSSEQFDKIREGKCTGPGGLRDGHCLQLEGQPMLSEGPDLDQDPRLLHLDAQRMDQSLTWIPGMGEAS